MIRGIVAAATGHRPQKLGSQNQYPSIYGSMMIAAMNWIEANKPVKIITGMALGWDTAWAMMAISFDIPFIAALPFHGQDSKWGTADRNLYAKLLKQASEIIYVSQGAYNNDKYQKRNEWMVNNCDKLVALWNGSPGGTANCIEYAMGKLGNENIINLWSEYERARSTS